MTVAERTVGLPGPGPAGPDPAGTRPGGRRRRLGVLAGFFLGLLAFAVGTGLGPGHLAKEGASPAAVVGLLLLAVGLVLVGGAAFLLVTACRKRWWPLVVSLIVVATYLAVWTLGQAVAASYAPRPALGDRTPADLGLTYRDVTFPSRDGVELAGWYVPSRNGAGVALMHGAGSTRSAVLPEATVLAEHGYGVLLFDARGHGQSDGPAMDFGWYGEADASGAVDFLLRQPDVSVDRVGLVGASMGGEQAIGAAGLDGRVAAVVAEGATNRVAADKGYLAVYGARGQVQQGVDRLTYAIADLLTSAPQPGSLRDSVAVATGRADPTGFLLITAGLVPDERLAADFIRGSRDAVQTWTVPDAGHTEGLETSPAEWEERVTRFLDDHLRGAGP